MEGILDDEVLSNGWFVQRAEDHKDELEDEEQVRGRQRGSEAGKGRSVRVCERVGGRDRHGLRAHWPCHGLVPLSLSCSLCVSM